MAAEKQGITEQLHDALSDIDQASLRDFLGALIRTHVVHAPRRLKEVEEAERQLRVAEMPVAVLPGVREVFARTSNQLAKEPLETASPTLDQAFDWLFKVNGVLREGSIRRNAERRSPARRSRSPNRAASRRANERPVRPVAIS